MMINTFFSPLSEFQRVMDLMDRSMGKFWTDGGTKQAETVSTYTLPIDVWQTGSNLYVRAAVPGVLPDQLEINFQDGALTISGEMKQIAGSGEQTQIWRREYVHGHFSRTIRLPDNVIDEKIEATFDNGFVTIAIPLMVQERKSLRIPIKGVSASSPSALEQSTSSDA